MSKRSKSRIVGAVTVALSGVLGQGAMAAENFWTGTTSIDWNTGSNWSLGHVPEKAVLEEDAIINTTTPNAPTISVDPIVVPRDIIVGIGAGTTGVVNQTGGTASTGGGNWLIIGKGGGNGTYNLANPGGPGAVGTFTQMAKGEGSLTTNGGRLYLSGEGQASPLTRGTMNVNTSGTATVGNDLSIGASGGTGTMNFDAGTINVGGWLSIGRDEQGIGGTGNWNQSGGALNVTNAGARMVVGLPGTTGNFNMSGGTAVSAAQLWFGQGRSDTASGSLPGIGNAAISGGTVSASNWVAIGREGGIGNVTVSGGTLEKTGTGGEQFIVGAFNGGNGTLTVSGGLVQSATDIWIGEGGCVGVVTQSGGTVRALGLVDIQHGGTGTYTMTGGVLSADAGIDGSDGTFTFTGGSRLTRSNAGVVTYTGNLVVGDDDAGFALGTNKTFAVTGLLDVALGATFDVTGQTLPGGGAGWIPLGTVGSILGTFDPTTTHLVGLGNPAGATFITEAAGEGGLFNPATQSVFWVQESGGAVTLQFSVVPEPGTVGLLALAGIGFVARRRRG